MNHGAEINKLVLTFDVTTHLKKTQLALPKRMQSLLGPI